MADALTVQVKEVISILQNHLIAEGASMSRDERRSLLMCIHRLERGLEGKTGTDIGRTLHDWIMS